MSVTIDYSGVTKTNAALRDYIVALVGRPITPNEVLVLGEKVSYLIAAVQATNKDFHEPSYIKGSEDARKMLRLQLGLSVESDRQ